MIFPVAMLMEGRALFSTVMGAGPDATDPATLTLCAGLMLLNGVCYACYNLMSFVVLGKTDVVTHAALNILRRVFIIVSTSLFFGIQLTRLNVAGVLLAVLGAMAYSLVIGG
jgi:drug/metabolite transporter (DMT)-like permease